MLPIQAFLSAYSFSATNLSAGINRCCFFYDIINEADAEDVDGQKRRKAELPGRGLINETNKEATDTICEWMTNAPTGLLDGNSTSPTTLLNSFTLLWSGLVSAGNEFQQLCRRFQSRRHHYYNHYHYNHQQEILADRPITHPPSPHGLVLQHHHR